MAGVDFEPDFAWQALDDIVFANCTFFNNSGFGAIVAAHALSEKSLPIRITFDGCYFMQNRAGSFGVSVPDAFAGGGIVAVTSCYMTTTYERSFLCYENPAVGGVQVRVANSSMLHNASGTAIDLRAPCNNVEVSHVDVTVGYPEGQVPFLAVEGAYSHSRHLTGSFYVLGGYTSVCVPSAAPGFNFTVSCQTV